MSKDFDRNENSDFRREENLDLHALLTAGVLPKVLKAFFANGENCSKEQDQCRATIFTLSKTTERI